MKLEHAKLLAATAWIATTITGALWLDAGSSSVWFLVSVVALGPATMILYLPSPLIAPVPRFAETRRDVSRVTPRLVMKD